MKKVYEVPELEVLLLDTRVVHMKNVKCINGSIGQMGSDLIFKDANVWDIGLPSDSIHP